MTPGLTKTYKSSAGVAKRRIVKFTADRTVAQASAASAPEAGAADPAPGDEPK